MNEFYILKTPGLYELRQEKYRSLFLLGFENNNDVCAVNHTLDGLEQMVKKSFATPVDFSELEIL